MKLSVSLSSDLPLYQQIYDSVAREILLGELEPGAPLPPIRTLALELGVSVISVKRAWEELERDGYILTAVGRGTVAASLTPGEIAEKRRALLSLRLREVGAFCRSLRAAPEEICEILLHDIR